MKKNGRQRLLSSLLCFVMVLSLIPLTGIIKAEADAPVSVSTATELYNALVRTDRIDILVSADIKETVGVAGESWVTTKGIKTLDLNGHTVKLTVKEKNRLNLIMIDAGATLNIYDSSAQKTGQLISDADITSGNEYRFRCVLNNKGTLRVFGGDICAGHYESFYSAKYVKTVYKMTTGVALVNVGTAYIYGGTFTGRNGLAYCMYNGGDMTIYDAKLYGKGGADGLKVGYSAKTKVYAIEVDLNKETAVENDHVISSGYPLGSSGITKSMLIGDYKITKQSDAADTALSAKLTVVPALTTSPVIEDGSANGVASITIPVVKDQLIEEIISISHFTKNVIALKSATGAYISSMTWHYRLQYLGTDNQWHDLTQGDLSSVSYGLKISNILAKIPASASYSSCKIILSPTYVYTGWSHSYTTTDAVGTLAVTLDCKGTVVTFNANGGNVSPTQKAVIVSQNYGTLPTPERKGFSFDGWYTAATGGTMVTSATKVTNASSHTLYAHWQNASAPKFTRNLPYTTMYHEGSDSVNFTVETQYADKLYWEFRDGMEWTRFDDGDERMQLIYSNGDQVTYRYTGELGYNNAMRCVASNAYGSTTSTASTITTQSFGNSNEADTAGQFLMYVEDRFSITGRGLVLSGRVTSGELKLNDPVTIITPADAIPAQVTGIEMFHKALDSCCAGDNVGLLVRALDEGKPASTTTIPNGSAIIGENSTLVKNTTVTGTFKAKSVDEGGRKAPLFPGNKVQAVIGASDQTVTISDVSSSCIAPGDTQTGVKLTLTNGTVMYYGQSIDIREGGKLIGVFTVTNVNNKDNGYVKITFDYQGGGEDPYATGMGAKQNFNGSTLPVYEYLKSGESYGELPSPVKEGYIFTGWSTAASGGTKVTATSKVPSSSGTLYAQYTKASYITLTFNGNGADTLSASQRSQQIDAPYGTLATASKAGYIFLGWYTSDGTLVKEGDDIRYKVSHTLTAKWEVALDVYPVFTTDLPEKIDLMDKVHPVDGTINYSFKVAADDANTYSWVLTVNGKSSTVGSSATLDLSKISGLLQQQLIANGGTLKCVATSAAGLTADSKLCTITFTAGTTDPAIMLGDVDFDGHIKAGDARLALRCSVGLEKYAEGSKEFIACDVNKDSKVTAADARMILRASVGLENPAKW